MHMRNVHQILGYNLDYPVDAVVTWVKEDTYGNPKGGAAEKNSCHLFIWFYE
jgi:hypothetical protein